MRFNLKKVFVATVSSIMTISTMTVGILANQSDDILINGTHSSGDVMWQEMDQSYFQTSNGQSDTDIIIDPSVKYQKYKGIGISLDETGVSNLWKLDETQREKVIEKLVSPTNGAGLDHFRITIGSPDCIEHIPFWSYDDMPEGQEDWNLEHFSIKKDIDAHIIDTIHLIQKYNPDAQFFASAWSAPGWMTTTGTFTGKLRYDEETNSYINESALRDDCIEVFARYYAKFIKAYENEGIKISAITELNEPSMDVIYPSMSMSVEQQQKLAIEIKKVFKEENIDTELWMHDFNFWDWKYPEAPDSTSYKNYYNIFNGELGDETHDAADGIGFHPYWGDASAMLEANLETGKPVYLTEAGGMDPGTIMDYFRLNCSSYNGWTQITDQNGGTLHWVEDKWRLYVDTNDIETWTEIANQPGAHWKGRLVTVNIEKNSASYNNSVLSGLGHFAKYLEDGDQRVYSSDSQDGITNVVYNDEDGNYVMVLNNTGATRDVDIHLAGKTATVEIESGFSTLTWTMPETSDENNHAPLINDLGVQNVSQFEALNIQLKAQDEDGDSLVYYGVDIPAGMKIDPNTGMISWVPGSAGEFNVVVAVTDGKTNTQLTFKVVVAPAPVPLPNRIDTNITNITDGTSATYQINAKEAGTYMVEMNYSTNNIWSLSGQKIALSIDGNKVDEKALAITWSGNGAVIIPVELTQGIHELKLDFSAANYNLNYINIYQKPVLEVPGKIEAEDYSNSYGVNHEPCNGRYNVSETNTNDWLEYDIHAKYGGTYTLALNSASESGNAQADIYIDDVKVGSLSATTTGSWSDYQLQAASNEFELSSGNHRLKIIFTDVNNGTNIDYLEFNGVNLDIPSVDKTELESIITKASSLDLSQYITPGKDEFTTALQTAKEIFAKEDATQEEVNSAINNLNNAMAKLVKKADKTALNNAIATAEAIDLSLYQEDGQEEFKLALNQAKEIAANEDALESEVIKATETLLNAQNSLKLKEPEIQEPTNPDDPTLPEGTKPGDPNNQNNQTGNSTKQQPSKTKAVKTGDDLSVWGLSTMMIMALGSMLVIKKKR